MLSPNASDSENPCSGSLKTSHTEYRKTDGVKSFHIFRWDKQKWHHEYCRLATSFKDSFKTWRKVLIYCSLISTYFGDVQRVIRNSCNRHSILKYNKWCLTYPEFQFMLTIISTQRSTVISRVRQNVLNCKELLKFSISVILYHNFFNIMYTIQLNTPHVYNIFE